MSDKYSQVDYAESTEIFLSSQSKYSHPSIIFVQGVNPYLQTFFQISKKNDLPPIPWIHSAERIREIGRNF